MTPVAIRCLTDAVGCWIACVLEVVMLKSAILLPKNSICPILPLNKNYLKPKITLKYPNGKMIAGEGIA